MQYTHLFVATIIGFIFPLYALLNGSKTRLILEQNQDKLKMVFQSTGIILLTLCGLIIVSMIINKTPLQLIGLSFIFNPLAVLAMIALIFIGYWIITKISIIDKNQEKLTMAYKDILYLFPENKRQYNASVAVSVTAGVCEEIMFRGFLYWQLLQYMPVAVAFILTNILFAIGHGGTKLKNATSTFVLGIIFSTTYLLTDSLWLAIILHIWVDFYAMNIGFKLKQKMNNVEAINVT